MHQWLVMSNGNRSRKTCPYHSYHPWSGWSNAKVVATGPNFSRAWLVMLGEPGLVTASTKTTKSNHSTTNSSSSNNDKNNNQWIGADIKQRSKTDAAN